MKNSAHDKLKIYLKSPSRNKIVIHRGPVSGLKPVNVGKGLAARLEGFLDDRNISFKAKQEIDELFKSSTYHHPEYGNTLSVSNPGILFEPELKIDFNYVLDKYSTENILFVQWEGEIEQNKLYLLTKTGIKINLDNLSYITL